MLYRVLLIGVCVPTVLMCAFVQADDAAPFGLEGRVVWNGSRVVGSPDPAPPYRAERIWPHVKITQPLSIKVEPGARSYLVIQHLGNWAPPGRILRLWDDGGVSEPEVLIELDGIAYGLDFHRDYERNGYLFVGQNLVVGGKNKTRVSRFRVERHAPFRLDPKSELVVIEWDSNGHNGGDVAFGGDGMLYVTSGDGTSDSDTDLRGQDLSELTSKVLRIDVDNPEPGRAYSVPADNPFVGMPGARPETWAYGLRNPWRISYDRLTDQLWVGNNGQDLWETAYLVERGANYGWSVYEGSHPFQPGRVLGPTRLVPPTVEHHHSEARSLTGGVVYHGEKYSELKGAYIYGDYSTGKIWAVRHDGGRVVWHREIADTPLQITGFGLDRAGELIVIDHQTAFHRLVPTPVEQVPSTFPTRLSETGLFLSTHDRRPDPALIPYSVASPLWSDGALKERYIAIPGEGKVRFTRGGNGWTFPEGSVLVKTFLLEREVGDRGSARPIETRLLTRQQGEWVGYSYEWDERGQDATLVGKQGEDRVFRVRDAMAPGGEREQAWRYPSRAECMTCHSRAANFVLGLSELQMNRDHGYGAVVDNQLRTLEHIGLFESPLPKPPVELDRLVDPYDESQDLTARVRSYLQTNCATCHVEAGGGNALMELGYGTPLERMRIVDARPQHDTFGLADPRLVAPGAPGRSVLLERVRRRGPGQMPPLATSVVDEQAVALLRAWIEGLERPQE